jgi:hypothetical protein
MLKVLENEPSVQIDIRVTRNLADNQMMIVVKKVYLKQSCAIL